MDLVSKRDLPSFEAFLLAVEVVHLRRELEKSASVHYRGLCHYSESAWATTEEALSFGQMFFG